MQIINYEFKAKVDGLGQYETKLLGCNPVFFGIDYQIDTYFKVQKGRLKLREGNIENALINYDRENVPDVKESKIILYKHNPDMALKKILTHQLGVKVTVFKERKIYLIDNVKFHFDRVENLGTFIEVEAIDSEGKYTLDDLKAQCNHYFQFFELEKNGLIDKSYCELVLEL